MSCFSIISLYSPPPLMPMKPALGFLEVSPKKSFMTRDRLLLIDEQMGDLLLTQDFKPMFLNRTSGYILLP
jgi:hypothetical protein